MSGFVSWKESFQLSPIYLTGDSPIVSGVSGGIVALTSLIGMTSDTGSLDDYFANFIPMPGATLVDNQIATYPFANQSVAANALIPQPLQISMKMVVPVRDPGGYWLKQAIMLSLQSSLQTHNTHGGTYTIATPSYFYTYA